MMQASRLARQTNEDATGTPLIDVDDQRHNTRPVLAATIRADAPARTSLEANSFAVLGATMRDNKRRLLELAEEQALHGDERTIEAAKAELINPRARVAAEVAWLPGTAPARVNGLLARTRQDPGTARSAQGLPPLATANLMVSAIELMDPQITVDEWTAWLVEMAEGEDEIAADTVLRDINEDRAVAGFPGISDLSVVETAIVERRQHYKNVLVSALDRVQSTVLVEALTAAISETTAGGHNPAPTLIEEIGASYELQATAALEKGAGGITAIAEEARRRAKSGAAVVDAYIDQIDLLMRRWDRVAQPIQLLTKSRGLDHDLSKELAYKIRSLAVYLVNEHSQIAQGARLTQLLADVFAELPELVEQLDSDGDQLRRLAGKKEESEQDRLEWEKAITYSAEVGAIFKQTLAISPSGVSWKGQTYPLETISRVRWGAVRHSVNGIPTGTTYTIAVGDRTSETVCEMGKQEIWSEFVDRLWRAVGFRITTAILSDLGKGRKLRLGEAVFDDLGVSMPRHAFFGSSEPVYCRWHEVHIWTANGGFFIGSRADKKVYAHMDYLTTDNLHFVEMAIRKFFKGGQSRLSQAFDE